MPEKLTENHLAILGDEDIILGLRALGFQAYPASTKEEILTALEEMAGAHCALCLVQEDIYALAKEQFDAYESQPLPAFITFSKDGNMKLLEELLRETKLKATGAL